MNVILTLILILYTTNPNHNLSPKFNHNPTPNPNVDHKCTHNSIPRP